MARKQSKMRLSVQSVAVLERLRERKEADHPFQVLELTQSQLRTLMSKDLILESEGPDGVKYRITGRGEALLESGNYYTFQPFTGSRNGQSKRCEECPHRQLLDQVKERIPAVQALEEKRETLDALKNSLRAGDNGGDDAIIREMYTVVTDIDALLEQLETYDGVHLGV
jgi:hypothetical protein